jgi:hypothetical protein
MTPLLSCDYHGDEEGIVEEVQVAPRTIRVGRIAASGSPWSLPPLYWSAVTHLPYPHYDKISFA